VSFAASLEAASSSHRKGPACALNILLAADSPLDPDDRSALAAALADERVAHKDIATALADVGHRVAAATIGRHRRRECACR
jgi:hypothetical protein